MPSTRNPTSIQAGPGRLSANVVTASALTAPLADAGTSESDFSVVAVSSNTALTRRGRYQTVLVTALSNFSITLPTGEVGDIVTFVRVGGTNVVTIAGDGGGQIHGFTTAEGLGSTAYVARSFVCLAPGGSNWASISEKTAVQTLNSTQVLSRAGSVQLVTVDTSVGNVTLTLPTRSQVGDRITFVKMSAANTFTIVRNGASDLIDGVRSQLGLEALQSSVTLVRTSAGASGAWTTVGDSVAVLEATSSLSVASTTANEIHVLVHTNDAGWGVSGRTITLPAVGKPGVKVIISDVGGGAATFPVIVNTTSGGILGVSSPTGTSTYTFSDNYGAVTLMAKATNQWVIVSTTQGLVENFSTLARVDSRSDSVMARLRPTPMFNWSHRRVALHAEFAGLITNILPVDGFTTAGDAILSRAPGVAGTVGQLRITVPATDNGAIHLGELPTDDIFNPQQLLGFRAILTPVTANPGTDYDIHVGFGDNIFETNDLQEATRLGANSLYLYTANTGFWAGSRVVSPGGGGPVVTTNPVVAGNRYVLEYYFSGTTWDVYVNGQRTAGGSSLIPTAMLNFGLLIRQGNGVVDDYVVDVDSLTVFTLDLGATRHDP